MRIVLSELSNSIARVQRQDTEADYQDDRAATISDERGHRQSVHLRD